MPAVLLPRFQVTILAVTAAAGRRTARWPRWHRAKSSVPLALGVGGKGVFGDVVERAGPDKVLRCHRSSMLTLAGLRVCRRQSAAAANRQVGRDAVGGCAAAVRDVERDVDRSRPTVSRAAADIVVTAGIADVRVRCRPRARSVRRRRCWQLSGVELQFRYVVFRRHRIHDRAPWSSRCAAWIGGVEGEGQRIAVGRRIDLVDGLRQQRTEREVRQRVILAGCPACLSICVTARR